MNKNFDEISIYMLININLSTITKMIKDLMPLMIELILFKFLSNA